MLKGADLSGANFRPIAMASSDGEPTGRTWPPNLENCDLTGARLTDAYFKGANLAGAAFTDAEVDGATFIDCHLDARDSGWLQDHGAAVG